MRRGELYRVRRPPGDPKPARVFVVVSRQPLIDSTYSTVICAPVFTQMAWTAHSGFGEQCRRPQTRKRNSVRWTDEPREIQIDRLRRRIGFRQTARTRQRPAYCPWASD